jgi:hypothetical protein
MGSTRPWSSDRTARSGEVSRWGREVESKGKEGRGEEKVGFRQSVCGVGPLARHLLVRLAPELFPSFSLQKHTKHCAVHYQRFNLQDFYNTLSSVRPSPIFFFICFTHMQFFLFSRHMSNESIYAHAEGK